MKSKYPVNVDDFVLVELTVRSSQELNPWRSADVLNTRCYTKFKTGMIWPQCDRAKTAAVVLPFLSVRGFKYFSYSEDDTVC